MRHARSISARRRTCGRLAGLALAAGLLSACGGSDGKVAGDNWGFENGDLSGWQSNPFGDGAWHAYSDGSAPPDRASTDPNVRFAVPDPPQGRHAAVTDMRDAGARILHRTVKVEGRRTLRMTLFYVNAPGKRSALASPSNLDFHEREPNQQFRVELMDPSTPVNAMAAKDILATVFRTRPGDPESMRPRPITFDLSPWAGKSVRIRIVQVDNRGPLRAGVDDIRIEAR